MHHMAATWLAGQVMAMGLVTVCLLSLHTIDPNVYFSVTFAPLNGVKVTAYSCVRRNRLNLRIRGFTVTRTPAGLVRVTLYLALTLLPTLRTVRRCVTSLLVELSTTEKAG
jgi:hypothetical protein